MTEHASRYGRTVRNADAGGGYAASGGISIPYSGSRLYLSNVSDVVDAS